MGSTISNWKSSNKVLSGWGSVLLDSLRIIAALTVFIIHGYHQWFKIGSVKNETILDHASVIIFFVLSGYVIAYTTNNRNRGPKQYAVARLSRLCSVVIPALIVTGIIQIVLNYVFPDFYLRYTRGGGILSLIRYFFTGFFINEIWFLSSAPPLNTPLWSLSFEFWYYVIFGAFFFRKVLPGGIVIFFAVTLIAGPKILLMMPIWLFGCFAYWLPRPKISSNISWVFILSLLGISIFLMDLFRSIPEHVGMPPLFFANQFLTDWMSGLLIGVALWIIPTHKGQEKAIKGVKSLRKLADLTFPLYVLHFPLLVLMGAILDKQKEGVLGFVIVLSIVFLISISIGILLEKQRPFWNNLFVSILNFGKKQQFFPQSVNNTRV